MRCFIVLLIALATTTARAQDIAHPKVSTYAPVKVVESQLKYFADKIAKDLASQDDYGDAEQQRVALDASTVSVLAQVLGMHDEESKTKGSAASIISASQELADNSEDFGAATDHHAALTKAMAGPADGQQVDWEPAADLSLLMKQVPIVNNLLRKGVMDKRRFARNADKTAGRAVTLAAIAQISLLDTSYCSDEDEEKEWRKICADMRDACADVYKALLEKDQEKAKAGNAKVVETCDACHHKFRD